MKVKQRDLKGRSWVGKINLKRKRLNPYLLIRVVLEIKRKSWLLVLGVSISGSIKIQSFYINAYIFDFGVCWDFGGLLDFVGV
jgi:hypothetical protein